MLLRIIIYTGCTTHCLPLHRIPPGKLSTGIRHYIPYPIVRLHSLHQFSKQIIRVCFKVRWVQHLKHCGTENNISTRHHYLQIINKIHLLDTVGHLFNLHEVLMVRVSDVE